MLAGRMIRFSNSSVLFVLWVVCAYVEGGLSPKALWHSKMTQGIDIMQAPFIIRKCKDRENVLFKNTGGLLRRGEEYSLECVGHV